MKHLLAFIILCLLIPDLFAQNGVSTSEWNIFVDTAGKFTAKYPPSWKNKIKEGNRVFFTSPPESDADKFYENINIGVTQDPAYGTTVQIKDLFPSVTEQLKAGFIDFESESQRFFKWNKMDACEIIYTGYYKQDESLKVRVTQWFCFYKTRLYTLTYVATADNTSYAETAKAIMNSIVFK